MEPSRMPRYDISNDGMGPYAVFYCDRDERQYRSNPSIGTTIKESVQRGPWADSCATSPSSERRLPMRWRTTDIALT